MYKMLLPPQSGQTPAGNVMSKQAVTQSNYIAALRQKLQLVQFNSCSHSSLIKPLMVMTTISVLLSKSFGSAIIYHLTV